MFRRFINYKDLKVKKYKIVKNKVLFPHEVLFKNSESWRLQTEMVLKK